MTAKYVLYTAPRSGAASVEVMLAALGLEVELKEATPWSDPRGPYFDELMSKNPLGQLPTLVTPGGEILTESVAVLWTLGERHPSPWVPPVGCTDRASCLRWMQFVSSTIYAAVGVADYPERWTTSRSPAARAAVERAAVARMRLGWDVVASHFPQRRGFLLGDQPLICDVYLSNVSRWWQMRDYLHSHHPSFAALLRRVDRLPLVNTVWRRHWP